MHVIEEITTKRRKCMNNKFDEVRRNPPQSVTPPAALKKFSVGLAGTALITTLLAITIYAPAATLGPLIELSRPDAVGTCDDGITGPVPCTISDDAESYVVLNPMNPKNLVA